MREISPYFAGFASQQPVMVSGYPVSAYRTIFKVDLRLTAEIVKLQGRFDSDHLRHNSAPPYDRSTARPPGGGHSTLFFSSFHYALFYLFYLFKTLFALHTISPHTCFKPSDCQNKAKGRPQAYSWEWRIMGPDTNSGYPEGVLVGC